MEVTGFHNERGEFVRLTEPLRIPTEDIPTNPDGTFNTEELMALHPARGETWARPSTLLWLECWATSVMV